MARRTPTTPVSPTQLKHFAAATVALTALLALFASGEETGIAAQVKATQAKNDLVAAEREKLGTKKIASNLKVRNAGGGFGADDGGVSTDGGFGGGASATDTHSAPSTDWSKSAGRADRTRPQIPTKGIRKSPSEPSASDHEAMLKASQQRSGGSAD